MPAVPALGQPSFPRPWGGEQPSASLHSTPCSSLRFCHWGSCGKNRPGPALSGRHGLRHVTGEGQAALVQQGPDFWISWTTATQGTLGDQHGVVNVWFSPFSPMLSSVPPQLTLSPSHGFPFPSQVIFPKPRALARGSTATSPWPRGRCPGCSLRVEASPSPLCTALSSSFLSWSQVMSSAEPSRRD